MDDVCVQVERLLKRSMPLSRTKGDDNDIQWQLERGLVVRLVDRHQVANIRTHTEVTELLLTKSGNYVTYNHPSVNAFLDRRGNYSSSIKGK